MLLFLFFSFQVSKDFLNVYPVRTLKSTHMSAVTHSSSGWLIGWPRNQPIEWSLRKGFSMPLHVGTTSPNIPFCPFKMNPAMSQQISSLGRGGPALVILPSHLPTFPPLLHCFCTDVNQLTVPTEGSRAESFALVVKHIS